MKLDNDLNDLLSTYGNNLNVGLLVTNGDLDKLEILYVNEKFKSLCKYNEEELIGYSPKIFQGPKTDRNVLERLKRSLSEGDDFVGETTNYDKFNKEYTVKWVIRTFYFNDERYFLSLQIPCLDEYERYKCDSEVNRLLKSLFLDFTSVVKKHLKQIKSFQYITKFSKIENAIINEEQLNTFSNISSECDKRIDFLLGLTELYQYLIYDPIGRTVDK